MTATEVRPRNETLRRKAIALGSFLVLMCLGLGAFFGDRGFLHLKQERARSAALEQDIAALRAENAALATEIHALRSDPRMIEKLAREELGLVHPSEVVFLLSDGR